MRPAAAALAATALLPFASACGGHARQPLPRPLAFGHGPRYHPPPYGPAVAAARPVGALRCSRPPRRRRFLAHIEVIAGGRVALVPAGIGIAPPQARRGAYVTGGRCEYPLRMHEPTGLIEVASDRPVTVGDLFRVWGQPLTRHRLAGFVGDVSAFVGPHRRRGDPRSIPLRRHSAVTLEVGPMIAPRPRYVFPQRL